MEPEGSLPCSQEPAICPYPEQNESNPHTVLYILNLISSYRKLNIDFARQYGLSLHSTLNCL
jgi:hypothetical protein